MPAAQFDHAAYIAEAVSAPYQTKRRLPVVRAAPPVAGYVRPVQRSLFELCGDPHSIQPGIPRLAKPEPVEEPEPAEEPSAMDRLVASGIANEYIASLGALMDPDNRAPYSPRSIGFPVTVHRVGGPFQPPTAPRIWELHLSTPACGDIPFVRRVEEVTGLTAGWVPDRGRGSLGQWHHAVDLATDSDWERLVSSMEHTTPRDVSRAVGLHVLSGSLSAAHACRLLPDVGIEEPKERAFPNLRPNSDGSLMTGLDGWEAVYAVEDGLIVPGNPKRSTFARVTDAGWRSVGKEPPAPAPKKVKVS
ncbi:hypothetical protein [Methylobacterium sp. 37f]|uniref:hypothetical protein n=1 Tax=Methylobacterium sp. 37f TaxID=2817058 RepID=UPI001FFCC3C6|nr:hypothetical protein [Methylobacterium sp. 37f]MCK2057226.1 hypothetical protein [Methylobacterium sp. 37f]